MKTIAYFQIILPENQHPPSGALAVSADETPRSKLVVQDFRFACLGHIRDLSLVFLGQVLNFRLNVIS